jgi:hypothetical protein
MSKKEQRVWQYVLANRKADIKEIAEACGVEPDFVGELLTKIGTPESVWRAVQETEDEDILVAASEPRSIREAMLNTAKALTCGDRNKSYGPPHDNLSDCAALWEAYLNTNLRCFRRDDDGWKVKLTSEDVAWMMVLTKMTRSFQDGFHFDNYVDAAAYSAIAGECREIIYEEGR